MKINSFFILGKVFKNIIRLVALFLANLVTVEHFRSICSIKNNLLRLAGIKIDDIVFIDRGFKCLNATNIRIEKYVSMGHDNHIWAFAPVSIGCYTQTAKDLLIISGSHDLASFESLPDQNVVIGSGCWIGARVTILGGVKIGKGCVIGASSLVSTDIPDWSVAAGVPARVIRQRVPAEKIISPFGTYSLDDI